MNAVSRQQLRDDVLHYIRELIVSGQVQPGEPLRLASLASGNDVSITPVREALLLLSQEGWVVQEPNRGFRVAPIHREDVEDAYLIHAFAAGEAATRAAGRITPEEVVQLRKIDERINGIDVAEAGLDENDSEIRVEQLNYELHGQIYSIAASPRLTWFIEAAARFVPRRFWALVPGWIEHNRAGHKPVIDALEAHDADRAREEMTSHINGAQSLLLEHLDALGFLVVREDE